MALLLDHVSLAASFAQMEQLGFRVTPTPGAGEEHGRVHLDRAYLEVGGPPGDLAASLWFVRGQPPAESQFGAAERYDGHDGVWLDRALGDDPTLPILTERIEPAGDWPPPLDAPHPNGAVTLQQVHVTREDPAVLGALGIPGVAVSRGPAAINAVVLGVVALDRTASFLAERDVAVEHDGRRIWTGPNRRLGFAPRP